MLHYIIKRGKKEVRAFYLNPMSFSLFLFDFSSANLFELLLWVNDFFNLRSVVSTIACQTIRIHDQRPQHIHSYPVPIVESILSTSQCQRSWYDIEFTSSSSFPFPIVDIVDIIDIAIFFYVTNDSFKWWCQYSPPKLVKIS